MEFSEKLHQLRIQKGLTQEELAEKLFVSRTAVSKWESGRGYPNIDSLKAISKFFNVTVDELLSGEMLLTISQEDKKEKVNHIRERVFGLLDISTLMLAFLPFFGQKSGETVQSVSLLALANIVPYLKWTYCAVISCVVLWGILTLTFQGSRRFLQVKNIIIISLLLNIVGTVLFVISQQPYAATFLLTFLIIKALMLIKWQ